MLFLVSSLGWAERKVAQLQDGPFSIYGSGAIHFANSAAARISGAEFAEKFTNPVTLNVGIRARFLGFLSLGLRYEYWLAQQRYTLDGASVKDRLSLQGAGPEVGIQWGNPRAQYAILGAMIYPFSLSVNRTGGTAQTFTREKNPYYYLVRLLITIKFSSKLGFFLESGYRKADFGNLTSDSQPFIAGGDHFNLSGPFFGTGISFHF